MPDNAIYEMISAFAAGCMDKDNFSQFRDYVESGGRLPEGEMGELQKIISLIPVLLKFEPPPARLKDKVAKRMLEFQDELKEEIKKRKTKTDDDSDNVEQLKNNRIRTDVSQIGNDPQAEEKEIFVPRIDPDKKTSITEEDLKISRQEKRRMEIEALKDINRERSKKKQQPGTDKFSFVDEAENDKTDGPTEPKRVSFIEETSKKDKKTETEKPVEEKQPGEQQTAGKDSPENIKTRNNIDNVKVAFAEWDGEENAAETADNTVETSGKKPTKDSAGNSDERILVNEKRTSYKQYNRGTSSKSGWIFTAAVMLIIALIIIFFIINGTLEKEIEPLKEQTKNLTTELNRADRLADEYQNLTEILNYKDAVIVDLIPENNLPGASGRLIYSSEARKGLIKLTNLPDPGENSAYQLWMINRVGSYSLGLFIPNNESEYQNLSFDDNFDVENVKGFQLTIEPASGSDSPTGSIYLKGEINR